MSLLRLSFTLLCLIYVAHCQCPMSLGPVGGTLYTFPDSEGRTIELQMCDKRGCKGSGICKTQTCCNVCQNWQTGAACLGQLSTVDVSANQITLHYDKGGDPVNPRENRIAVVTLTCGSGKFQLTKYSESKVKSDYTYVVEGTSQYACPGGVYIPPSASLSGGWFFIIFLIVFAVIYIGVGVTYSKVKLQEPGILVFPPSHVEFWKESPALAKDGFMFFLHKVSGGSIGSLPGHYTAL